MRVFAQNEQRQRKAKEYAKLYERREKERVGEKRVRGDISITDMGNQSLLIHSKKKNGRS